MKKNIALTDYIANEKYFSLPKTAYPMLRLEIFNKKKNEWRKNEFEILIRPMGKKKKTDEKLRIIYIPNLLVED